MPTLSHPSPPLFLPHLCCLLLYLLHLQTGQLPLPFLTFISSAGRYYRSDPMRSREFSLGSIVFQVSLWVGTDSVYTVLSWVYGRCAVSSVWDWLLFKWHERALGHLYRVSDRLVGRWGPCSFQYFRQQWQILFQPFGIVLPYKCGKCLWQQ